MNNALRKLITVITAATLIFLCAISGFAYTFYVTEDGLLYRDVTREEVAIGGLYTQTESIVIPSKIDDRTVVMLDDYAMRDNTMLKSVDFSAVSEGFSIGEGAFLNCSSLENVIVPNNVRYIYEDGFRNCTSLKTIDFQAKVSLIPMSFFSGCSALEEFSVPRTVNKIKSFAFAHCSNLVKVLIPENVTEIENAAFYDSPNVIIYCYEGSYAQTYAEENSIPYIIIQDILLGDVDGIDGVNISDATAVQSYLAELRTLEGIYLYAADANQDGDVDITDATAIQMKVADYELPYPIGQYITKEIVSE